MAYDANGNVTNMPGVGTIAYDARNRITGSGGVPTRGYDPGNRKIWWKDSNGITFVDYWLPNGEKLVTYKIDEAPYVNDQRYPGPVQFLTVTRTLYFAGRQVKVEGRYGVGGYVEWPQPDRLSSNARHHPYGEERSTSSTEYKFATYQREASGLDYALNRYYSSVYGRFLSSDPYRASGGPSDPGSWNRYAYVQGDPVNWVDRKGLMRRNPGDPCPVWQDSYECAEEEEVDGGGGWGVPAPPPPPPPPPPCSESFVQLGNGAGHYAAGPNLWGQPEVIDYVNAIGELWDALPTTAGAQRPRFGVTQISREDGGPSAVSRSHRTGLDVDIRILRTDGKEAPATIDDNKAYDRAMTTALIKMFQSGLPAGLSIATIYFEDGDTGLSGINTTTPPHRDHFHLRFKTGRNCI